MPCARMCMCVRVSTCMCKYAMCMRAHLHVVRLFLCLVQTDSTCQHNVDDDMMAMTASQSMATMMAIMMNVGGLCTCCSSIGHASNPSRCCGWRSLPWSCTSEKTRAHRTHETCAHTHSNAQQRTSTHTNAHKRTQTHTNAPRLVQWRWRSGLPRWDRCARVCRASPRSSG